MVACSTMVACSYWASWCLGILATITFAVFLPHSATRPRCRIAACGPATHQQRGRVAEYILNRLLQSKAQKTFPLYNFANFLIF
jgi:hypothetical protein